MIFVTVGTHEQPFNRLIKKVDDLIIKEIVFYESTCFSHNIGCYKESVKELIPLYIGKVLELWT